MQNNLSRRMFSVFGFFAILTILFSTPTPARAENIFSKTYTTYIIEPGVFAIETLNEMFSTLTGGSVNLLANTSSSTESSNIIDDYIIEPLGNLLYSIFDFSVDVEAPLEPADPIPDPVSNGINETETTITTINTNTTTPSVVNYYTNETSGSDGAQGPKGDTGPQGPRGERGPAGSDANFDTSNFVNSSFFDNQVDGILGSIEDGIEGLSSSLSEEINTGILDVTGSVTIGSALAGTDKALVVNNNTSTGNIAEFQDGGTAVVTIADGGNVGVGTSSPIAQLHVAGKVPTAAIGNATAGSNLLGLYVQGRYAYTGGYSGQQFGVWDISNPASPALVGSVAMHSILGIYVQGAYAYVVHSAASFSIVDISNQALPTVVGTVSSVGSAGAGGIYVQGSYAYITDNTNSTIRIFDVSKPTTPVQVSSIVTPSGLARLFVQGRYLYAQAGSYLKIIDVQNPLSPTEVGSATTVGKNFQGLYVQGKYAYLTDNANNRLDIFDVSAPTAPVSIATIAAGISPIDVYVQGNYAYVINNGTPSLQMFDVSVPTAPVNLGSVTSPDSSYRVHVQGRYAYTVGEGSAPNFKVFDVGGSYIQQFEAGGIESGTLTLRNNLQVGNDSIISGGLSVGQSANVMGGLSVSGGGLSVIQNTTATGALKGIVYTGAVNTNQTASTEIPSLTLTTAGREWATGALATQREVLITQPTYSFAGASTITNAATMGIAGAPIASTNATLTNSHGLLIQAGAVGAGTTNSYGLTVNAQTGAANNYAAQFMGGNVGIGTAAPTDQLTMVNSTAGLGPIISLDATGNGGRNYRIMSGTTGNGSTGAGGFGIVDQGSGLTKFAINSSGYVGIGTINPTTTHAGGLEISGTNSSLRMRNAANTGQALVEYADEGSVVRFTTGYNDNTSVYAMVAGSNIAATTGMMIDTSGNVGIGTAAPMAVLNVKVGTNQNAWFRTQLSNPDITFANDAGSGYVTGSINGTTLLLNNVTQGNVITGGSVGIGTTTPGKALEVNSATGANMRLTYNDADGSAANYADLSTSSSGDLTIAPSGGDTNITGAITTTSSIRSGTNSLFYGVSDVAYLELYNPALGNLSLGITVNDSTHGNILFKTNNGTNGERMRITNVGNLKIGGTALRGTTEGTNHLDIFDGTAPSGTLTNGVSLYSDTGELRVMDAAGNNTLLSPHEDENNYWVFDSTNSEIGKSLIIDMEEMMKKLNNTFGWDFVHETLNGVATLPEDDAPLVLPDTFFEAITNRIVAWFADASNGIGDLFADKVYTKELCVTKSNGEDFCVTGDQLEDLVGAGEGSSGSGGSDEPVPAPLPEPEPETVPTEDEPTTGEEVQLEPADPTEDPASNGINEIEPESEPEEIPEETPAPETP